MYFITGCFALAVVDSVGNLSELSEEQCFDFEDCMTYSLPNVFTPNGDGYNDLFRPFPYSNVQKIDMYIYNRWGRLVFKTEDPEINWNGCEYRSGEKLPNGNYYYSCDVYVYTLSGVVTKPLHGTIILTK